MHTKALIRWNYTTGNILLHIRNGFYLNEYYSFGSNTSVFNARIKQIYYLVILFFSV